MLKVRATIRGEMLFSSDTMYLTVIANILLISIYLCRYIKFLYLKVVPRIYLVYHLVMIKGLY